MTAAWSRHDRGPEGERRLADVEDGLQMPLEHAVLTQRAVRKLRPDPVDDRIVLRCIELALRAPTGSNGQNWEFVVVKDPATKAALGRVYKAAWSVYGGIGKRATRGDESQAKVLASVEWQVEHFEQLPVLVVACLRGARVPVVPMPPVVQSSFYGSIYP